MEGDMKEYFLDLADREKLLKVLEDISFSHSFGNGAVFTTAYFRRFFSQLPIENITTVSLVHNPKDETGYKELKEIIKSNLEPCLLVYRNPQNGELISIYFLPKAVEGNPCRRNLESGLHWLDIKEKAF